MNTIIWVAQIVLGLAFIGAGFVKSTQSRAKLQPNMPYVEDFSDGQIKGIGILELLGGLGLILPSVTGILPWLTPLAAAGLVIIMVGAVYTHWRRNEMPTAAPSIVLLALSLFVLYGRAIAETL